MRYFWPLILFCLFACSKPDPNPELKDSIYLDMMGEMEFAEKAIVSAKKQVTDSEKARESTVPQTGQIKYAEKRLFDAERSVALLEQQKKYWIIRTEQRRDFVREKSLKAFKSGTPWDNSLEKSEYEAEKRLRHAKLVWDSKGRREDFLKESGLGPKKAEGGEGEAKEKPKEH